MAIDRFEFIIGTRENDVPVDMLLDSLQIGDWVRALGQPFGLEDTVTAGIISGKNRDQNIIDNGDGFEDFLQTDAAINFGNSGGPLLDIHGRVIGVNTAIFSPSGDQDGLA